MTTEYELTLSDYASIMRRRAVHLIGIFVSVVLITVVLAFTITPIYRATGVIMVESQQVNDNIVPSAIRSQLDERINVIRQRVMTRENLLQIAGKYHLFQDNLAAMGTADLVAKMRDRVIIKSVATDSAAQQGQPATAFTISFEDKRPDVALQVTKDFIALFIDWSVKLRTENALETTAFLTEESGKLKDEVDHYEKLIAAYKRQNSENLPEQLNLRASMLARAENDLYEVERDIRSTQEILRSQEAELSAARHGLGEQDPAQSLSALKAEYVRLSAIYTKSHPDIKALKRKIEILERVADTPTAEIYSGDSSNLAVHMIQAKVDATRARMSSLEKQKKMLQGKIAQNENAMVQTPKVAQGLEALVRDRDNARKKYEEILGKKMNAQIAQNMESENRFERLSVLEEPQLPERPYKPNRLKMLVLGLLIATVSSVSAVMLLESIDKRIRGTEVFTHALGFRPLVVIPYIPNLEEEEQEKRLRKLLIGASAVALAGMLMALHFLYMPLNILLTKVLARIM